MRAAVVCLVLSFAGPTWAHPDANDALAALERAAAQAPCDATSEVRRGDLERRRGNLTVAAVAYDRAQICEPALDIVDLRRARLHLDEAQPERALIVLAGYLARHPRSTRAHLLRGKALQILGRNEDATASYESALAADSTPQPDLVLTIARLRTEQGDLDGATATLDAGIARLGAVPALLHGATELDRRVGRYAAALARLDALPSQVREQPVWRVERGELLAAMGRTTEARTVLQGALAAKSPTGQPYRPSARRQQWHERVTRALQQLDLASAAPPLSAQRHP